MNNIPPFQQKKIIYAYTSKLSHNKHSSKVNKLHKSQNFIQNDTIWEMYTNLIYSFTNDQYGI